VGGTNVHELYARGWGSVTSGASDITDMYGGGKQFFTKTPSPKGRMYAFDAPGEYFYRPTEDYSPVSFPKGNYEYLVVNFRYELTITQGTVAVCTAIKTIGLKLTAKRIDIKGDASKDWLPLGIITKDGPFSLDSPTVNADGTITSPN
jgi:hypothetical protein